MKPIDAKPPAFGPPPPAASLAVVGLMLSMAGVGISVIAFVLLWRYWQPAAAPATTAQATQRVASDDGNVSPAAAADELFISDDAAQLLTAAAESEPGFVTVMDNFGTLTIWGGTKQFCSEGGRVSARWHEALTILQRAGLVEFASSQGRAANRTLTTWRLTKAGYAAADAVKQSRY
jgi:hypothetical protein